MMTDHLRMFLKGFLALTLIGLGERVVFALHQTQVTDALSPGQLAAALLWGLRYDTAVAAMLGFAVFAAAHLLYRLSPLPFAAVMRRLAYAVAVVLIALHGADLLYFSEAGRHMGYELRDAYGSGGELFSAAVSSYPGPVLFQLALMVPALWLVRRLLSDPGRVPGSDAGWKRLLPEGQLLAALMITAVVGRGGFQSVPLEPLQAQSIGDHREAALALNGVYNSLFFSITGDATSRLMKDEPKAADRERVRALYAGEAVAGPTTAPKDYNVVMLFLESWSAAFVSSYGQQQPTTPAFDALRRQGLTSRAMLAGGQRTTEGLFVTLCSAQNPLGATVAQGQLQDYPYRCLPHILRDAGYETAFFQGTLSGTSGTGAFAQLLGFQQSYGKEHMELDKVRYTPNSWGVHDPDLYDFALGKMRKMSSPFLVGINTNTTHDAVLPDGVAPRFDSSLPHSSNLNTINFADRALGEFINKVRQTPDIGPTLFVLVADHTGPHLGSAYYNVLIPFAVVGPDVQAREVPVAASQRDIAPTLLELLGRPVPRWFTGQSLLTTDTARHFTDFYDSGELGWVKGDLLQLIPLREGAEPRCFDYGSDPWLKQPVTCPAGAADQRRDALAFTRVSQDLLFRGKLREFAKLRGDGVE